MEFNPQNPIIKLCMQGLEEDKPREAGKLFLRAWNEATNDFEKFVAAYYLAKDQKNSLDKLKWLETDLQLALKIDSEIGRAHV